jgi:nitroimidazol reductase NimA-like FMN-containing flavoprotein (pyridoxamine 5'-phosphate oxidase superfamily)
MGTFPSHFKTSPQGSRLPDRLRHPIRIDAGGRRLEELSQEACMARLARKRRGRLAVIVGQYPQVFPVNYRVVDHLVVFATHLGPEVLPAHQANVAFHVDHIDEVTRSGWSVLIQGVAEDVSDRRDEPKTERARTLAIHSWAPGEPSRVVRIIPAHVTGRQIVPGELSDWADEAGNLL